MITALTALVAAGGTLVKDIKGQREQELMQESVFNYATTQTAEIRERLARLEANIEWLKKQAEAAPRQECSSDTDCGGGSACDGGKCKPAPAPAMGAGMGAGAGHLSYIRSLRKETKPERFEDIKGFVQTEQKAWPAE